MCRLGCPQIILSDQGREFVNQLTTCLFEKTNTEHRITSAYHPQVLYCMKQYCIILSAVLTLIIPQYTNIFFNRQTD